MMDQVRMLPISSNPFGISWKLWVEKWWQWCSIEPLDTNPAADQTGKNCHKNQHDPNVWFLAGTFGGKAKRNCTIPRNKAILFPIITNRISYAEHNYLKDKQELSDYATTDINHTSVCMADVGGFLLPNLQDYRVKSDLFNFKLFQSNTMIPTDSQGVSDGYWVFLHPLPVGPHVIKFIGQKLKFDEIYLSISTGDQKFRVEVTYFIDVR